MIWIPHPAQNLADIAARAVPPWVAGLQAELFRAQPAIDRFEIITAFRRWADLQTVSVSKHELAVLHLDEKLALVHQRVMARAQQHQVGSRGFAAAGPGFDVMRVQVVVATATRDSTAAVT